MSGIPPVAYQIMFSKYYKAYHKDYYLLLVLNITIESISWKNLLVSLKYRISTGVVIRKPWNNMANVLKPFVEII